MQYTYDYTKKAKQYYKNNKDKIAEYGKDYSKDYYIKNKDIKKENNLFRSKKVCYGCYDFIMMLNEYI